MYVQYSKKYFEYTFVVLNIIFGTSAEKSGCSLIAESEDTAICRGSADYSAEPTHPTWIHLIMEDCDKTVLDSSSFVGLAALEKLEMRSCNVDVFESGALASLPALTDILLFSSNFQKVKYPFCSANANLQFLSIIASSIGTIRDMNENILSSCQKLKRLTLNQLEITNLREFAFNNIGALINLDLGQNNIRLLDDTSFSSLPQLQELSLSDNQIRTIAMDTFSRLTSLRLLRLDQNDLTILPDNVFDQLQNLKVLNLSGNSLMQLQQPTFARVHNLDILLVAENDIRSVDQFIFRSYASLKELDLSGNNIEELGVDVFVGLSDVRVLRLNKNNIKNVQPRVFGSLVGLEELDLSSNSLDTFSGDPFTDKNSAIKSLNLATNNIQFLQPRCFLHLVNLQALNIAHNQLETFSVDYFGRGVSLNILNVSYNHISEMHNASVGVASLYIDHNRLTYLPASWYQNRYLHNVALSRNPWQCGCLRSMQLYLKNKATIVDRQMLSGKEPVCVVLNNNNGCTEDRDIVVTYEDVIDSFMNSLSEKW